MGKLLFLLLGVLLGGCAATVFLCCLQGSRMRDYEAEIKRLKEQLK